jgi:hypothetical protein
MESELDTGAGLPSQLMPNSSRPDPKLPLMLEIFLQILPLRT